MTLRELRTLFNYDKWATDKLLEEVARLPEEQYVKDLGSSHGGIRGTLVHIFAADRIWLERWKGNSPARLVGEEQVPTLLFLMDQWTALRRELDELLNSLSDEKIQARLGYRTTEGTAQTQPLYQQMQHRINHSTYHRGQVVTFLRQLGCKPPSTDLILFYRRAGGSL